MTEKNFIVSSITVLEYEACATIYVPNVGDLDVLVYEKNNLEQYLITIPEFAWCSHVSDFDDFNITFESYKKVNAVEWTSRGFTRTLGDIFIPVPELNPFLRETKLLFSILCTLLEQKSKKEDYPFILGSVDKHLSYCKTELEKTVGFHVDNDLFKPIERWTCNYCNKLVDNEEMHSDDMCIPCFMYNVFFTLCITKGYKEDFGFEE